MVSSVSNFGCVVDGGYAMAAISVLLLLLLQTMPSTQAPIQSKETPVHIIIHYDIELIDCT